MGMTHRGRLNVLANILGKPYQEIFAEFEENFLPGSVAGDGDVRYHLGISCDRTSLSGHPLHLSLTPNPSHLEAVDPVVEGRVRAKQDLFGDTERQRGLPLLIHGDAAFAGQGLVAETLNLSQLAGFKTGGTIHVIINNQIGFTTSPNDARSTTYCTDVAKMIQVPIFHVNAEDPEAAVYVAELAMEFRQTFHKDVVIDMFCYRRHGHNEGDEPSFTQPLMYAKIKDRPTLSEVYTERLILNGDFSADETEAIDKAFEEKLHAAQHETKSGPPVSSGMRGYAGRWQGFTTHYSPCGNPDWRPRGPPPGNHRDNNSVTGRFFGSPQDCPTIGGAAGTNPAPPADRLVFRGAPGLWFAAAGRSRRSFERTRQWPGNLQSTARRSLRHPEWQALLAAQRSSFPASGV
jgi:2-oxoglutarate dehydrogenase E1 component